MDESAGTDFPQDFGEGLACFLLGLVSTAELLSLSINDAGINGELVANRRLPGGAAPELDAADLGWKLATVCHPLLTSQAAMLFDEFSEVVRPDAPSISDLHPGKFSAIEQAIDR